MSNIAVDIVLLLPTPVAQMAIELSKALKQPLNDRIDLGTTSSLPHITLAMAVIKESDLPLVKARLAEIARKHLPIELNTDGFIAKSSCWLGIAVTDKLLKLHQEATDFLLSLASGEVTLDVFNTQYGEIEKGTIDWVKDYPSKYAGYYLYSPHVTLGIGDSADLSISIKEFKATEMALCHIGSHGTCAKVLFSSKGDA